MSNAFISFADMEMSLENFRKDAKDHFVSTDPLAMVQKEVTQANSKPAGQAFVVEIHENRCLETIRSPRTYTVEVDGVTHPGCKIWAKVAMTWHCTVKPTSVARKRPTHFYLDGLCTVKCTYMADVNGNEVSLLSFHSDIQTLTGPKPTLHFQLPDKANRAQLELPRLISVQSNIIDVLDLILSDLFDDWPIQGSTPRRYWEPIQRKRFERVLNFYLKAVEAGGWSSLKGRCAHTDGLEL
ncbi:MAG: hypothetical protein ABL962_02710 [Fimbriimonadaceae bacterium]